MSGVQRREQLLDATKAIVVADGFHAVSIEAVARGAGITRPIVYGHFDDLGGLLETLVERESRRALHPVAGHLRRPARRAVGLPRGGADRPGHLAARADAAGGRAAPAARRIAAGRAAVIARLALALEPGAKAPDPELSAHLLSAHADEAARLVLQDYDVERILELTRWALARLAAR
jgi:AcrR family transcriptional regulator